MTKTTEQLKTQLLVIAREKIAEVLNDVDPVAMHISTDSRIFIKDEVGIILSSALSQMEDATREEMLERVKEVYDRNHMNTQVTLSTSQSQAKISDELKSLKNKSQQPTRKGECECHCHVDDTKCGCCCGGCRYKVTSCEHCKDKTK